MSNRMFSALLILVVMASWTAAWQITGQPSLGLAVLLMSVRVFVNLVRYVRGSAARERGAARSVAAADQGEHDPQHPAT